MKIFGIEFKTKKELKAEIKELKNELDHQIMLKDTLLNTNSEFATYLSDLMHKFPFNLGDTLYDIQLRNIEGKYTRVNPSKEHSLINEITVNKRNYFSLIERYARNDVFKTKGDAENYLSSICN